MAQFAMNTSVSTATNFTPFFLLYGRQPVSPLNLAIPVSEVETATTLVKDLQVALDQAVVALNKQNETVASIMNKKTVPKQFIVGEKVLLSTQNLKFKGSRKFKQRFAGPFNIIEVVSPVNYKLELPVQWV